MATIALAKVPLPRLAHRRRQETFDEDLADLYRRADHYRHVAAIRKLAHEIVARPGLDKLIEKAEVYGILARIDPIATSDRRLLEHGGKRRNLKLQRGGLRDLAELGVGLPAAVARPMIFCHHIRNEHIREPGIARAMFTNLFEAGVVGSDGRKPSSSTPAKLPACACPAPQRPGKIRTPAAISRAEVGLSDPGD